MEEMVAALAGKYGMTEEQVQDALELVLSGPAFRRATGAAFGELAGNGIVVYGDHGKGFLGETRRSLSRVLSHDLERVLRDAATATEYDRCKHLRGQAVSGRIERIDKDGTLSVAIPLPGLFGETAFVILAVCSPRKQPLRERGACRPGETRMFLVERIATVRRGGISAVRITLSRTSPRLTEKLLKRELKERMRLACVKRVAGRISYVEAERAIPREAIVKVGKELGERIKVRHYSDRDRQEP